MSVVAIVAGAAPDPHHPFQVTIANSRGLIEFRFAFADDATAFAHRMRDAVQDGTGDSVTLHDFTKLVTPPTLEWLFAAPGADQLSDDDAMTSASSVIR